VSPGDIFLVFRAASVAVLLLFASGLTGFSVLPRRVRSKDPVTAVLSAVSVGLTLVSLLMWILGYLIGLPSAFLVILVLVGLGVFRLRAWVRLLLHAGRRMGRDFGRPAWILILPAAASVPALLLPVIDSDGLRYHLALPKLFMLTGKVFLYPWDMAGAYPQSAEMLYMSGLAIGPPEISKFLHFFSLVLGCCALMHFIGDRVGSAVAGWAFLVAPVVLAGASAAFIDGFVVLHLAVALLLLKEEESPWAVGLCLSGALWTKWTAGPAIGGLFVLGLFIYRKRSSWRMVTALVLPSVLVIAPLAIRNFRALGDPFFPVLTTISGREIPSVDAGVREIVAHRHADIPGLLGIAWGAYSAQVEPDEIVGWHLFLALLVWPFFLRDRRVLLVSALIVPYLVLGIWVHPSARLVIPLIWALATVFGVAAETAWRRFGAGAVTAGLGMIVVSCLPLLLDSSSRARDVILPYVEGHLSRDDVLRTMVPGVEAAEWINERDETGTVMAMDFPAPFLFNRPWIVEGLGARPPLSIWLEGADSVEDIMRQLDAEDIRFIVVTPGYGGGSFQSLLPLARTPEQERLIIALRERLRLVWRRDGIDIFKFEDI